MFSDMERQWKIPLIASFVGSIYIYTVLSAPALLKFYIIAVIGTLVYSLYNIWRKYTPADRNHLFYRIALFAVLLHGITIPVNYFFQGLIGIVVGLLVIYFFFEKTVKV